VLTEEGHEIEVTGSGKAGLAAIRKHAYDAVLLDMKLPDINGMEILKVIQKEKPGLCTIVMTGYSTVSNAVEAGKLGATDYLSKPFTDEDLISVLRNALRNP
jgi:DNA-binding NtrC family response regulator